MWTTLLLSLTSLSDASDLRFYPGSGNDMVDLPSPERLTGTVLAHVSNPVALEADPDIARVVVLKGDGHVVRVEPRFGVSPVALANRLHDRDDVTWSHPDMRVQWVGHALPDDPYLDRQWHLDNTGQGNGVPGVDLNASEAWDITDGTGTLVAVIDSGVDIDHPDLSVIDGPDFIDGDDSSDPQDGSNHGTAVAGLVASIGNNGIGTAGVAYGGDIYGLRLINGTSTLESTYNTFVDAVDAGADVINNSWGLENPCEPSARVASIDSAYDYAEKNGRDGLGSLIVFSAGNDSCDIAQYGMIQHPSVIAVAAVSRDDTRENYSNFGTWVDISAPSGGIVTTDIVGEDGGGNVDGDTDYTRNFGGTSAAAPQVSGVIALMIAANDRLLASEIRSVLCDTAVRNHVDSQTYDETGWSPLYGCGRIDAGAAVRAVANAGPPEPPELLPEAELAVVADQVVLSWPDATDPDGDTLRYRVRWAFASNPDNERTVLLDRTWLDLSETLDPGDEILWRVRGVDLWGPGEWSETQRLTVTEPAAPAPEPEPSACGHVASGAAWLWWVPGLWLLRRRRT